MIIEKKYKDMKAEIDKNILAITKTNNSLIQGAINDLVKSGGKRLRPVLVLLSSRFGNYEKEKIYKIAAGIEIFHMSTLIHDDIIDQANIRRGTKTAQKKYGNKMAVFIGDYLLSKTLEVFEENVSSNSKKKMMKIVSLICEGEITQHQNKFNYELGVRDYLKRIRKKTALLFALSMYLGGYESKIRGKKLYHLYKFGLEMGMAFQIEDDLLDFEGEKEMTGKKMGQDLKNGIFSLPIILLMKNEKNKEKVVSLLNSKNIDKNYSEVLELIYNENKIQESRQLAKRFVDRAKIHLAKLPDNNTKKFLIKIINKQIKRRY